MIFLDQYTRGLWRIGAGDNESDCHDFEDVEHGDDVDDAGDLMMMVA